jgi:hypothetical protein
MYHEVRRIRLDHGGRSGCADDVGLVIKVNQPGHLDLLDSDVTIGLIRRVRKIGEYGKRAYHIAAQPGACHGGEEGSTCIILTPSNDSDSSELAYAVNQFIASKSAIGSRLY